MTSKEWAISPQDSMVRRRELGDRLRAIMQEQGCTARDLVPWLGGSESHLSRLLTGSRGAREVDVATLLTACKVTGAQRNEILALCNPPSVPGMFYVEGEHRWWSLRHQVARAVRVTEFQPNMIPWIAQTPQYTRAVVCGLGLVESAAEPWTSFRIDLARRIDGAESFSIDLFLHEWALHTPIGGLETMSEQVHRLLRLSVRPAVSVHVVPASAGTHPGIVGGFSFLEFDGSASAVYREDEQAGWFLETSTAVRSCQRAMSELRRISLTKEESRTLLRQLALGIYRSGESPSEDVEFPEDSR